MEAVTVTPPEALEDEEVVFKGSAIYQHLQDVGCTDFEPSVYMPTSPCQEATPDDGSAGTQGRGPGRLAAGWRWWCRLPHRLLGRAAHLVQMYVCVSVGRAVRGSRCVSEDDWLVLEHFLPQGYKLLAPDTTAFPWHCFLRHRDVAVIMMCLALLWVATEDPLFLSTLLIAALVTYAAYCTYWVQKTAALKQFVLHLKATNHLASKSARLLQEMDLISKGFMLAVGPGAPLVSLYEEPPQLSSLSAALESTVTAVAHVLLSAHTALPHREPHYPLIRHLFDPPPPRQHHATPTQRMHHLKSQVAVMKLQTSAVLTELLLWLHTPKYMAEYSDVVDYIASLYTKDAFLEKTQSLKKHYEYNKCFWLTERPSVSESVEARKQNAFVALHSLALHLQAALLRVQGLEAKFERESDLSNLADPETLDAFPSYEHFQTQMNALKLELESCQGCLEEAEVRAERKYGVPSSKNNVSAARQDTSEEELTEATSVNKPTVLLYNQQVLPPEDEVFEAYISEDSVLVEEEAGVQGDDVWCGDVRRERQRLRRQKEQGRRVLKELQPILSSRRRVWEDREKVALLKHSTKGEQNAVQIITTKAQDDQGRQDAGDQDMEGSVHLEELDIARLKGVAMCSEALHPSLVEDQVDEEDSDEERLLTYRRVKQELDEDEQQRVAKEARLKSTMEALQSSIDRSKEGTTDEGCAGKEVSVSVNALKQLTTIKLFPLMQNSGEDLTDSLDNADGRERVDNSNTKNLHRNKENKINETKTLDFEVFSSDTEGREKRFDNSNTKNLHRYKEIKSPDTKTLDFEVFSSGDEETTTNSLCHPIPKIETETFTHNNSDEESSRYKGNKSPDTKTLDFEVFSSGDEETTNSPCNITKIEAQTFTHNDSLKDDESGRIDWTTFTPPSRPPNTLEERLDLYSGRSCLGIQAEVAAQASAASRNFWLTAKQPEETFGGVGEGEVFGSDSEEDSGSGDEN